MYFAMKIARGPVVKGIMIWTIANKWELYTGAGRSMPEPFKTISAARKAVPSQDAIVHMAKILDWLEAVPARQQLEAPDGASPPSE